ncbi:ferredoxin [Pseudonocardia pini]|uniref:ferredoxin n=1 Tax=Pseudonocardia pini TaxID=2758030 RepID=UPI0015F04CBC|nr:ferredoxin [Pseudonocardia pini]
MRAEELSHVEITPATCLGSGLCTFYAADTFDLDDEGRVRLVGDVDTGSDEIANAVEACPTRSIRIVPHSGSA